MISYLIYLTASRPDTMFATKLCAHYKANPKEYYILAVKRILCYLKHTQNIGLWYPHDSEFKLIGYTYSDHVRCDVD